MSPIPEPLVPSPAARERIVEVLTRYFANDELTEAELDRRLQRVYAATSGAELSAIIADLPAFAPRDAVAVRPARSADSVVEAVLSGQERRVLGVVPRELTVRARLGYVELDLTKATFQPGLTTIDVHAFMGYVQIRLPSSVRVESTGRALFGFFSLKGLGAGEAESVVRITGSAAFGFAEAFY